MDTGDLISVVMPAYNAGLFIKQSIESVLVQTYSNWELVIVDDDSTDNTKEITTAFTHLDNRVRYIHQANGKQGKARNTGITNANGDLIAFLDADDLWAPEMLEKQFQLIRQTKSDLVFSFVKYIDVQNNLLEETWNIPHTTYEGTDGLRKLLRGNCIPIFTVVAKKASILNAGSFKESNELQYGEDYDLWLRMLINKCRFTCNSEFLAFYRRHHLQSSGISKTRYLQMLNIIKDLKLEHLNNEKEQIIGLWLRRAMRYSNKMKHKEIRKLIKFIPSRFKKNIALGASYLFPLPVLKKFVQKLS